MKSEPNEGNSDLQQLVQALKQSRMMSSEVSEARRNLRAPRVYSVSQFVQYADLVRIKPSDRRAYLLTKLDQLAFKAVELLKFSEFLSFDDFTAQLIKRFDSGKITSYSYVRGVRSRTKISRDSRIACWN